jgi:PPOX class probable F420-dependent enzyme
VRGSLVVAASAIIVSSLCGRAAAIAVARRRVASYAAAMLSDVQRGFVERARVAHLATADSDAVPHVVPVCFCLDGASLYITLDEKPKRRDLTPKRIRNIMENPAVAVTVDHWDEDWSRLGWVMLRGIAEMLPDGAEHDHAQSRLSRRYKQYQTMDLAPLPVIAIRIRRVLSWGNLDHAALQPTNTHQVISDK